FGLGPRHSGVSWHIHGPGYSEEICLEAGTNAMPFICDIGPGEILHFPSMWWHAVLNLEDYNVFVSTFTQE
ncbi:hypothetical protein VYU27_010012, partial [Nannochloropsis oceanica]